MIQDIFTYIQETVGLEFESMLTLGQMALRAFVIYFAALFMIRLSGDKRFLGRHAAFDVILGIILGSLLSRAINGTASFVETIGAGIVLVGMHWFFAVLAFHSSRFGRLINGEECVLVQEGKFKWDGMRKGFISKDDLLEALRIEAHVSDTKDVKLAYLERNGYISIIPSEPTPQIVEVDVEDGVQTVRLEIA
ncbi:DUF421 domain-containing protein [candidate division KSB1 bacterium]|nr:DUF421 domain-containing protein [candidate division KSB1 bacterium]NIR68505.1 DUF421 domain-containing protein [candidate division KSB1 bacterium]NIS22519.1 DUF421 domain-containing protein [candidate division KSB1 bacterium]NIT69363.1 DUF421 domain-containing protein [candidate division KSB1 bacterium]NIU23024.1 DUF421 domain-containing protein [candidate division KSB1 bacterium]